LIIYSRLYYGCWLTGAMKIYKLLIKEQFVWIYGGRNAEDFISRLVLKLQSNGMVVIE
jgi:hypothetical protein